MTRPSPRKVGKARAWKAWARLTKRGALGGVAQDTPLAVFKTRDDAGNRCLAHWMDEGEVIRVEIREVLPRKAKGARRVK